MLLRIDPQLSVLWRSVDEVQIGAPDPVATIRLEDAWALRVFELLRIGIEPERLRLASTHSSVPDATERLDRMLAHLERTLTRRSSRIAGTPAVFVGGDPTLAANVTALMHQLGVSVADDAASAQLVVVVAHFLARPEWYQPLMSGDVPHLAIICDDQQVRLSPLVVPGRTACLFCLELHHRDQSDAWPTLSVQLLRRRAASASGPLLVSAVAELATQLFEMSAGQFHLDRHQTIRVKERISESVVPHPRCACCSLPENVTVLAPREPRLSPSSDAALVARA